MKYQSKISFKKSIYIINTKSNNYDFYHIFLMKNINIIYFKHQN
jgi:hypothetical protein